MKPRLAPGLTFLVAAVMLGALAIANLTIVADESRSGYDYGGMYANEERAAYAKSVVMRPGDRLVVEPNLMMAPFPTLASYDFYVVKGGDRFALLDGNETAPVYVHVANMTTQSCCANPRVVFTRPDDETWRREGRIIPQTGPGIDVDMRALEQGALDQPERIDLVWVFRYREGFDLPENETEQRRVLSSWELQLARGPPISRGPTVLTAQAVMLQPIFYAAMTAAAVVAAGAAVAWMLRLRRPRDEPPAAVGTEALIHLHERAGLYLASLRDLLVASVVVVGLVGLHVALLGEPQPVIDLVKRADVANGLRGVFLATLTLLYAVIAGGWIWTVLQVQGALRRWRRRRGASPLDPDDSLPDA